jgi:hypothetical protein
MIETGPAEAWGETPLWWFRMASKSNCAAMVSGNLRQRFREQPDLPTSRVPAIFEPTPPLLGAA